MVKLEMRANCELFNQQHHKYELEIANDIAWTVYHEYRTTIKAKNKEKKYTKKGTELNKS